MDHPDSDLIAYRRGDLGPDEAARVERHVAGCPACRDALATHDALLGALAAGRPAAAVDWRAYRAGLETRVARRRRWAGWPALVPLAVSASVAAVAVAVVWSPATPPPAPGPVASAVGEPSGDDIDLLRHYPVVERLDLLEDLDVVRHLDRLLASGEG